MGISLPTAGDFQSVTHRRRWSDVSLLSQEVKERQPGQKKKGFRPRMCNMKSRMHKLLFLFFFLYTKTFSRGCKAQRPAYSFRDWNESDFTEVGRCSPLAGNLTLHRFMPRDIRKDICFLQGGGSSESILHCRSDKTLCEWARDRERERRKWSDRQWLMLDSPRQPKRSQFPLQTALSQQEVHLECVSVRHSAALGSQEA